MAKSPIRKTIELLLKKIEALENQGFSQKLVIDELENRLEQAEQSLLQVKENPFANIPQFIPYNAPAPMPLMPLLPLQPPYQPLQLHICVGGPMDSAGNSWCVTCGNQMNSVWTITSGTTCQADPSAQSSTGVEFDLDIDWDDTFNKIT